ncbi:Putative AC transposase [Linum grandiflorum]
MFGLQNTESNDVPVPQTEASNAVHSDDDNNSDEEEVERTANAKKKKTSNLRAPIWKEYEIISFTKIASHKADDIGDSIASTLEEWGIRNVLCCTVDNASANDGAVRHLKEQLASWGTSIMDGKYLHVRCVAHIINLVVTEGLREIGISVRRVRECVKWVNSSPAREETFEVAVAACRILSKKKMCMDVPTRWNSTYLMLQSTIPFEMAIDFLPKMNRAYEVEMNQKMYEDEEMHQKVPMGPATLQDFVKVKKMVEYLHRFYILTNLVSGTAYVTSHLFFKEMCDLLDTISGFERNEDLEIKMMGARMKLKVGKYWMEEKELNPKLNKILYIAAVLDPRQKMRHVEKCLKKVYGVSRATELIIEIKQQIREMFEEYKNMVIQQPTTSSTSNSMSKSTATVFSSYGNDNLETVVRGSCSTLIDDSDDDNAEAETSDLDLYLQEKQFKEVIRKENENLVVDKFDILVASESAFSTGGRVLNDFRTSLSPNVVEAVICYEDWLRSSPVTTFITDEEELPEDEQDKEYQMKP